MAALTALAFVDAGCDETGSRPKIEVRGSAEAVSVDVPLLLCVSAAAEERKRSGSSAAV